MLSNGDHRFSNNLEGMVRLHELISRLFECIDFRTALREVLNAAMVLLGVEMGNVQVSNHENNALEISEKIGLQGRKTNLRSHLLKLT